MEQLLEVAVLVGVVGFYIWDFVKQVRRIQPAEITFAAADGDSIWLEPGKWHAVPRTTSIVASGAFSIASGGKCAQARLDDPTLAMVVPSGWFIWTE